jgi:hypothetical protein
MQILACHLSYDEVSVHIPACVQFFLNTLFFRSLKDIASREGFRGLYKGFVAGSLCVASSTILLAGSHLLIASSVPGATQHDTNDEFRRGAIALSAAFMPVLVPIIANPFAVVQTRMMLDFTSKDKRYYAGVFDAFRTIWAREGLVAFYRGLMPTLWGTLSVVGVTSLSTVGLAVVLFHQNSLGDMLAITAGWLAMVTGLSSLTATPFSIATRQFQVWNADLPVHMKPSCIPESDLKGSPGTLLVLRRNVGAFSWTRGLFRGAVVGLVTVFLMSLPADTIKARNKEIVKPLRPLWPS